jgi:hypothetical protein
MAPCRPKFSTRPCEVQENIDREVQLALWQKFELNTYQL